MKKEIQRWRRDLEKMVGPEKAKETEVLVKSILISFMKGHIEALESLHNIAEQLSNAIKEYEKRTQDNIEILRQGD